MAAENMQKVKLLKLYEFLRKETDEQHPVSRRNLCDKLNEMGISSNVRTLSLDIKVLQDNGFEVMSFMKNGERFFYIPEQELSVPEIKILIDAVQAASFVTDRKTSDLVEKVAAIGGSHQAEIMKKNIVRFNTRKHSNESILYNVDHIEEAIIRRKKISFNYFHYSENAERIYVTTDTGKKKRYRVDPVALVFNEDNYYLMAYSSRHPERTANYRVDRMDSVEVIEDSDMSEEAISKISGVSEYTEQAFKMFSGKTVHVLLQFERSVTDPIIDKFGENVTTMSVDETKCIAAVDVQISPTFFGWIAQFGGKVKIVSPKNLITQYREHLMAALGEE